MKILQIGFPSFVALILAGACSTGPENSHSTLVPQRIQNPESVVFETGTYSESLSLLGDHVVLLLDYIPTEPGKAALAMGCLNPLPADFEVGYAICDNEERTRVPIYAKHTDQRCEVEGQELVVPATETLISESCTNMSIRSYLFDPILRILIRRGE